MVVLTELILNSFYIGRVWLSWKNWFLTVSILGRYGGLERTDFEQFLYWEVCGGLERTDFKQFLYWDGVVVLKELILNSLYIRKVWWKNWFLSVKSWKNWFFTVSILGRYAGLERTDVSFGCCGGLERTDFKQFLLWVDVVLKELTFNSLCIGNVWCSWKSWFLTVAHLGWCGGLEITDFEQFVYSEGVVVLKELIFNSFYIQKVWWSWKNWFWMVYLLGGCGLDIGCARVWVVLKELIFNSLSYWDAMVVLKELILNSFYYWDRYGGLERTDF